MSGATGTPRVDAGKRQEREALGRDFAARLLDAFRDPAYFVDARGRTLFWNEAVAQLTGYSAGEMLGLPASCSKLGVTDAAGVPLRTDDFLGKRTLLQGRAVDRMVSLRRRDGRRVPVEARCSPVLDDQGAAIGVLVALHDASSTVALATALRQARRAAESDPLTGLANRRALDRMLELRLLVQAADKQPFCLILADLDHFKAVNDGWGHAVGDRALTAFAEVLRGQSRAEDLVARLGGEEFVVLLPDAPLDVAARVAERLRVATPEAAPPELGPRRLSASFGVVEAAAEETASQLLRRADAALYRAKADGRDRVVVDPGGRAGVGLARRPDPPGFSGAPIDPPCD